MRGTPCLVGAAGQPDIGGHVVRGPESHTLLDVLGSHSVPLTAGVGPDIVSVPSQKSTYISLLLRSFRRAHTDFKASTVWMDSVCLD